MLESVPESADKDLEARAALWRAICVASEDVLNRFRVRSICEVKGARIHPGSQVPAVATWQLVEALSLLGVILRSEDAAADVINIFGKTGPIEILEDGIVRQLWAQQTLRGDKSALSGRPDLIVTSSREPPHPSNATRIIEAKCVRHLGTQTVRSEFGKAHDLRVATYLIWSFYSPVPKVVAGARGLGIDLEVLGFDTDRRADLVRSPEALISRVAYAQEQARRAQRFAVSLEVASQEARRKLLGLPQ
jgi:hypothetical protein